MAAVIGAQDDPLSPAAMARLTPSQPGTSPALDWATTALSTWFIGGVFLDGWAHNHIPQLESFFTPWHAVLYSGFAATALLTLVVFVRNRGKGFSWREALPAGYGLSLVGAAIFLAGGLADMVWHTLFGVEASVDALFSPTHLVLAFGGVMLASGPFRSWWRRPDADFQPGLIAQLPAFVSLTYMWSVLAFFSQYIHPFIDVWATNSKRAPQLFYSQALGTASIIVQTALLMGAVLLAMRRRPLPTGALTLLLTLNALLVNLMAGKPEFIAVALVAAVCAEGMYAALRPSPDRPGMLRLLAFVLPVILYSLYFAVIAPQGIVWSIHLWMGAIVLAGVTGWLLSYLVVPPAIPAPA